MSDNGKTYLTFHGIVQFDPKERSTSAGDMREVAIRLCNHPDGRMIQIALWNNSFSDVVINKGDEVVCDGSFTSRVHEKDDGTSTTYYNCTPTRISVRPTVSGSKDSGSGPRQVANVKKSEETPAF